MWRDTDYQREMGKTSFLNWMLLLMMLMMMTMMMMMMMMMTFLPVLSLLNFGQKCSQCLSLKLT